jgi:alkylhydroperoxidase family enzyme
MLAKLKELQASIRAARSRRKNDPRLDGYLEKVAQAAATIRDADLKKLQDEGLSEDEIFEATVDVALTAGIERYEAGMRALEGTKK